MKVTELRDMTADQLQAKLKELKSELFNLRFQLFFLSHWVRNSVSFASKLTISFSPPLQNTPNLSSKFSLLSLG